MFQIKCVFFDMDGTLTDIKSPWEKIFLDNNLWEQGGSIFLEKYLNKQINYIDFCKADLSLWNKNKLSINQIEASLDKIPIRKKAINVLKKLTQNKVKCIIVSTGFYFTAKKIALLADLKFEIGLKNISSKYLSTFANHIYSQNNKLRLKIDVNGDYGVAKSKGKIIKKCLKKLKLKKENCISAGDSLKSDIELIENTLEFIYIQTEDDLDNILKKIE